LVADLGRRLAAFGLVARLAIADTPGAAWAVARYGRSEHAIVPSGEEAGALRSLPLVALRLTEQTLPLLRRLGLRRIGNLIGQPRAPLAARFDDALRRLDQALGHAPEPLVPVIAPPVYAAQATFVEPISSEEHVLIAARHLLEDLARDLARDAAGARVLRLLLFRVDGEALPLELGLAAPSRDAEHIVRLIALRLDRLAGSLALDTDFGFEAAALHVLVAEPLIDRQVQLGMAEDAARPEAFSQLIDRLQQRLGAKAVRSLHPHQSHIPERAVRARIAAASSLPPPGGGRAMRPRFSAASADLASNANSRAKPLDASGGGDRPHPRQTPPPDAPNELAPQVADRPVRQRKSAALTRGAPSSPLEGEGQVEWGEGLSPRPLLMLPHPETAEVVALIPEGPPRQFRWRGVLHQVTGSQGPERIAPEWWRRTNEEPRDYYLVEDTAGRRFWLYRAGLYGRGSDTIPQWFVHGVWG
jgi:protein ImuB